MNTNRLSININNPHKLLNTLILALFILFPVFSRANTPGDSTLQTKSTVDTDSLVNFAKQYLGTPYRLAGRTSKGFDCSGFVHHVYKNFNVKVPYSCPAISSVCSKRIDKLELKKGDLLFFKGSNIKSKAIGHIAIVYDVDDKGNIHMIHSCRRGVILEKFNESKYYKARYLFAKRIL